MGDDFQSKQCPLLFDPLGAPTALDFIYPNQQIYFNRADVKAAIHAPDIEWAECAVQPVFTGGTEGPEQQGDLSADPIQGVLPKVIEATNRVLIGNGDTGT